MPPDLTSSTCEAVAYNATQVKLLLGWPAEANLRFPLHFLFFLILDSFVVCPCVPTPSHQTHYRTYRGRVLWIKTEKKTKMNPAQ